MTVRTQTKPLNRALARAVKRAGGQSALAAKLTAAGFKVKQSTVWEWIYVSGKPSAEACPYIEEVTGERCEHLLPPVFGRFVEVQQRRAA